LLMWTQCPVRPALSIYPTGLKTQSWGLDPSQGLPSSQCCSIFFAGRRDTNWPIRLFNWTGSAALATTGGLAARHRTPRRLRHGPEHPPIHRDSSISAPSFVLVQFECTTAAQLDRGHHATDGCVVTRFKPSPRPDANHHPPADTVDDHRPIVGFGKLRSW